MTLSLQAVNRMALSLASSGFANDLRYASSIEPGVEPVESIEFDIGRGYASGDKVPPQGVQHEAKWDCYVQQLAPLQLHPARLSRFLEKVCCQPCHPSAAAIEGWKLILPCLDQAQDWELPVACWNETEKALRNESRRPAILLGLQRLQKECAGQVARWLRLSPHNLCRTARRLGMFSAEKARAILNKARQHPAFNENGDPQGWLHVWGPLRPPDWLNESPEVILCEFQKRQPILQLDVLYRLLRS